MTGVYRDNINGSDLTFEKISKATHKQYPDMVSQGYEWRTNCPNEELSERLKKIEAEGLEAFVGDVAFGPDGILKDRKAILVRKKA